MQGSSCQKVASAVCDFRSRLKVFEVATFLFFSLFLVLPGGAGAERFFQRNSTWYEPIPENPTITANSSNYVADIFLNASWFGMTYTEWSVPIWQAEADTPITEVSLTCNPSSYACGWALSNEWNKVPIPVGALPAGNTAACAGNYRDGHMAVVSHDRAYSWEFYGARYCNGQWSTYSVRKWDLTGDGINYPYDNYGAQRLASVPLTHGIITYNEVVNEGTINHALAFVYNAVKKVIGGRIGVYPSGKINGGSSERTWAMLEGMRLQLNPSVDCGSLGASAFETMVCVALQDYGMILVDNAGVGYNSIIAENLFGKGYSWSGIITSPLSKIPWNQLRVIEPVYPDSSPIADTTPPTAPLELTATPISSTQINLSWAASTDPSTGSGQASGVAGYKIYRNGTQIATTASTSYTDTGLSPATTYTYKVSAYDAAGNNSAQSGSVSATTKSNTSIDTTPPSTPSGIAASVVSSTQINLSWTASTDPSTGLEQASGVAGYKVYRNGTQIATTANTSYANTGLSPATTYTYTVSAYDAAGNVSAQSGPVSVTTLSLSPLPSPSPSDATCDTVGSNSFYGCYFDNIEFTSLRKTRVDSHINFDWGRGSPDPALPSDIFGVRWQGDWTFTSGAYRFTATADDGIRIWVDGNLILDKWFNQSATTYMVDRFLSSGTHRIKVEYYENGGAAVARLKWAPVPDPDSTPPTIPYGLTAKAVSSTQIKLSWKASSDPSTGSGQATGVAGYKIYRNGTQIASAGGTSYDDKGLTPSTTYVYTVSAYDAAGNNSPESDPVLVSTGTGTARGRR